LEERISSTWHSLHVPSVETYKPLSPSIPVKMKVAVIALIAICVVGSTLGEDCPAKFQAFRKCLKDSHQKTKQDFKAKWESLKTQLDACYTSNGCTAPVRGQKGGSSGASSGESSTSSSGEHNAAGRECWKAVHQAKKAKVEECIKKAMPGFSFPPKDGEHDKPHFGHHRVNHKDENKNLQGCAKAQAVRDCKRALFEKNKPTEEQKKAIFKAHCDSKQACQASLGAECQAQMEKVKKAACQCHQETFQQLAQIRSSVPACKDVQDKPRPQGGKRQQHSCDDHKDYCKLGYEAFAQDHQKAGGRGKGGHH